MTKEDKELIDWFLNDYAKDRISLPTDQRDDFASNEQEISVQTTTSA